MEDESNSFVSRRGRRVSAEMADSSDSVVPISSPQYRSHEKISAKKPGTQRRNLPWKLITLMLLLGGLVVVIVGELVTWQYSRANDSARSDLERIITSDVLSLQDKSTLTSAELATMIARVDSVSSRMCKGGLLDNMAKLYPRAKNAHEKCILRQQGYSSLVSSLSQYEKEHRYLEQLGKVIQPLTVPLSDQFAVIGSQLEMWKTAESAIGKLSIPASMKATHNELESHAKAIMLAWSKLNIAYYDQNAVDFRSAEKVMVAEYAAFQAVGDKYAEVINASQSVITSRYNDIK